MSHKTQNMEQKQHTKKEMNSLPKKYEASYVFTDCITRIWPLINDIKNIETIIPSEQLSTILIDECNSPFEYSIMEMSSLECTKKVTCQIKKKNIQTQLSANFSLVSNTLDNTTLFTICLMLVNPNIDKSIQPTVVQNCKNLCITVIENVEKILKEDPVAQYEYESTEIECPIEILWDFLVTFDFIKVKCVSDLKYEGEVGKVGTIVSWNFIHQDGKSELAQCRIVKANNDPKRKKWIFCIVPFDGPSKNQEVKFTLINLGNGMTFISFYHKFNETVGQEQLIHLQEQKKEMLMEIKKNLEAKVKSVKNNTVNSVNNK